MPSLQVRDLPKQIYQKLQEEAQKEHRSFAQQAIVALARGLNMFENPKKRRGELLKEILNSPAILDGTDLPDPVDLVREDRER